MEKLFLFSVIWGFGGSLSDTDQTEFSTLLSHLTNCLPDDDTADSVFHYYVDESGEWDVWGAWYVLVYGGRGTYMCMGVWYVLVYGGHGTYMCMGGMVHTYVWGHGTYLCMGGMVRTCVWRCGVYVFIVRICEWKFRELTYVYTTSLCLYYCYPRLPRN